MRKAENCFACGKNNRHGMHLDIRETPEGVELDFVAGNRYEGWQDIIHGGIVATILDELMAWACTARGHSAVTGDLKIRFRQPLKVGQTVHGTGRVVKEHGRLLLAESMLLDESGSLVAEASGKMLKV